MKTASRIRAIEIDRLVANPLSPNHMPRTTFAKLKSHIARTGNYEPVVVRRHSGRAGCFEIINGAHRVEALKQLGRPAVDCVVWDVDDDETLLLLCTLNRLGGRSDLGRKSALFRRLAGRFDPRQLGSLLPDGRRTIQRLINIEKPPAAAVENAKAFLNPAAFFLTDYQKRLLTEAMTRASGRGKPPVSAPRRADALAEICRQYIESNSRPERDRQHCKNNETTVSIS